MRRSRDVRLIRRALTCCMLWDLLQRELLCASVGLPSPPRAQLRLWTEVLATAAFPAHRLPALASSCPLLLHHAAAIPHRAGPPWARTSVDQFSNITVCWPAADAQIISSPQCNCTPNMSLSSCHTSFGKQLVQFRCQKTAFGVNGFVALLTASLASGFCTLEFESRSVAESGTRTCASLPARGGVALIAAQNRHPVVEAAHTATTLAQ